ncbi:class F sortase [Streptomyces lonarensis]|uniref:Class F sortase n=2 Tax=Streptomyces lonarensis TaxID=700599 RepID=A0A7X6I0H9_9ACTN|nr:class F sortase [Streptomyces lonarensis]NJQ07741.1 class F sortase [Streptomyces lonarensis]
MAPGSERHGDETHAAAGVQAPAPGPAAEGSGEALARSEPTRIRVPHIGIDVEVFGADLDPDGGPPTPAEEDAMRAAWYAGGVSPGENGASLIVGHLDTMTGPAAFAGLGMLEPGGRIEVDREDGTTAVFTVEAVEQYPKQDFPNDRVYGATDDAQLRLITCGGRWTADGGYDANIVAYARLGDGTAGADGDGFGTDGAEGFGTDGAEGADTPAPGDAGQGNAGRPGGDPEFPYYPFVPEGERGDHAPAGPGAADPTSFSGVGLLETLDGVRSLSDLPGFDASRWTGASGSPADPFGGALPDAFEAPDGFGAVNEWDAAAGSGPGDWSGDGFDTGPGSGLGDQVEPFVPEFAPGEVFGAPDGA